MLYTTAVELPPGRFDVKVVVRENTSGLMGSFESAVVVPELKSAPLKVSAVTLSTQMQPAKDTKDNPLIRNGQQLVPNVTHIVGKDQRLLFYYEVYDPSTANGAAPDIRTSLAFYRGKVKVFETPVVERTNIDDPSRKAAIFQFEVPAGVAAAGLLHLPDQCDRLGVVEVRVPAAGVPAAVVARPNGCGWRRSTDPAHETASRGPRGQRGQDREAADGQPRRQPTVGLAVRSFFGLRRLTVSFEATPTTS